MLPSAAAVEEWAKAMRTKATVEADNFILGLFVVVELVCELMDVGIVR
jgi:hypothetical protein